MIEGQKRRTLEQVREEMILEPVVLKTSHKDSVKLAVMSSAFLGIYGGFLTLGVFLVLLNDLLVAGLATLATLLLVLAPFSFWIVRSQAGYEVVADRNGLRLSRFGRLQWSVPWSKVVIERYGLGRARLLMPDGRKVRLLEFATGDAESVRKMLRLLKPYSLRPHVTWQRGLIELVVSVAGMSAGLALAAHGSQRIDEYFDPEPTVQSLGLPLLYTCLGGVMAVLGVVAIIWSFRWLERLIKYSSSSHHGPAVDEFWSVFGKNLGPIQMEDGVKYRYLDPKALASQRKVAWPLFGSLAFMTVLITACVALLPPETAQPEAQWSAWIVCAVLAIATPLPLLFLKRERAQLALLQDTFWTEGDRLFVQRRDLVQSFSATPIRTKAQKKNQNSHYFLSSFEEFKNEAGTYRLDRRYLWPIDDHKLFDGE